MNAQEVVVYLKQYRNPKNIAGMARFGIDSKTALGVSMPILRKYAKQIGKNQNLAIELWKTDIHECRILAGLIAEPEKMTRNLADTWVEDFNSWDICDQLCGNLLDKTGFVRDMIFDYCTDNREFVRRTTFSLIAACAVHNKKLFNKDFENFYPLIIKYSTDERNFVKKAVNWALRQIGKRNRELNMSAIVIAQEILTKDSKAAKWIARDALRELQDGKILRRIKL